MLDRDLTVGTAEFAFRVTSAALRPGILFGGNGPFEFRAVTSLLLTAAWVVGLPLLGYLAGVAKRVPDDLGRLLFQLDLRIGVAVAVTYVVLMFVTWGRLGPTGVAIFIVVDALAATIAFATIALHIGRLRRRILATLPANQPPGRDAIPRRPTQAH